MLEQLRAKNPSLRLHTVGDPAFATFGRVVDGLEVSPLLAAAHAVSLPQEGTQYTASEPTFEALPIAKKIADELFGQMPTQVGFCFGHNRLLNAVEWHTSSEINVAVTPLVLILGHIYSIQNGTADADDSIVAGDTTSTEGETVAAGDTTTAEGETVAADDSTTTDTSIVTPDTSANAETGAVAEGTDIAATDTNVTGETAATSETTTETTLTDDPSADEVVTDEAVIDAALDDGAELEEE